MPLFEENPHPKNNQQNQTENCGSEKKTDSKPKEELGIIKTIGQLLPFAPLVFEQFTGQKLPAMGGTMAEIQLTLTQITTGLQTVVQNQQQLAQRIVNLETKLSEVQTNASQHLTALSHQFNSLRLTHTREKKEIQYNPNSKLTEENNQEY